MTMPDPEKGRGLAAEIMMEQLLITLKEKGVLDLSDVRGVLNRSLTAAGYHSQREEGYGAVQYIAALMSGPFSAR